MGKKILIIDDDPTVVKLIQERLSANGYEVIAAKDGEEGLHKVKDEKPSLIILDVLLPKMDGYTLVKELKKTPESKSIPIVIITIKEQLHDLFKQEGIRDYLVKPLHMKDLLEKVKGLTGDNPAETIKH